eukprot:scaffold170108_cov22-Tisochrysis_lutea.AAC.1
MCARWGRPCARTSACITTAGVVRTPLWSSFPFLRNGRERGWCAACAVRRTQQARQLALGCEGGVGALGDAPRASHSHPLLPS